MMLPSEQLGPFPEGITGCIHGISDKGIPLREALLAPHVPPSREFRPYRPSAGSELERDPFGPSK